MKTKPAELEDVFIFRSEANRPIITSISRNGRISEAVSFVPIFTQRQQRAYVHKIKLKIRPIREKTKYIHRVIEFESTTP